MWIKICGITSKEEANICLDLGANAIGFVFADSKRKIHLDTAKKIIKHLPPGSIDKVGVFVNAPRDVVSYISDSLNLDILQFHGSETPEYCSFFQQKTIKAFKVSKTTDFQLIEAYSNLVWACILDTYSPGSHGGTGEAWDWTIIKESRQHCLSRIKIIAAGGLSAGNVQAAIEELAPYGVDVSSGVEKNGQKDYSLIKQFVNQVRGWEGSEST